MTQAKRADLAPTTRPFTIRPPEIRGFAYNGDLASEFRGRRLTSGAAVDLLDDMLAVRELEEMIVRLRSGGYEPLGDFRYRGLGFGAAGERPHHQLAPRTWRRHHQGLQRDPLDGRRTASRAAARPHRR